MIVKIPKSKRAKKSIIYLSNKEHEVFARDLDKINRTLYKSDLKGELKGLDGKWRLEVRTSPKNESEGITRKILGDGEYLIYCLGRLIKRLKEEYESQFASGELTL